MKHNQTPAQTKQRSRWQTADKWSLLYLAYLVVCLPLINPPALFAITGLLINVAALLTRSRTRHGLLCLTGTALCVLTPNAFGLGLSSALLLLSIGVAAKRLTRSRRQRRQQIRLQHQPEENP